MPEKIDLYAGITLIKASDKTPKRDRVGNYYHNIKVGKYTKLFTIEQVNRGKNQ